MKKIISLIVESLLIGILTTIFGTISSKILSTMYNDVSVNERFTIDKSLFLRGFLMHLFCQIVGINKFFYTH